MPRDAAATPVPRMRRHARAGRRRRRERRRAAGRRQAARSPPTATAPRSFTLQRRCRRSTTAADLSAEVQLRRPERRDADRRQRVDAVAERGGARRARRLVGREQPRPGASSGGSRSTPRASRSRASAVAVQRPRASQSSRRASAWSAASTPTTTAPRSRSSARSAAARPTRAACCCARRRSRPPARSSWSPSAKDDAGRASRRRELGVDHAAGRALVRAGQRRPHRRAAREEALRARRDGAAAGAHAVPRGDRAGRGRARRRDRRRRWSRCAATTRRSSLKVEPGWGAERLRQRAGAARPAARGAVVSLLHLGLQGAARVVARVPLRGHGLRGADARWST